MNTCEILIYDMEDDMEMVKVQNALAEASIGDGGDEDMPMYLKWEKARSVFVELSEVNKAVKIINDLGYTTDEDEASDEASDEDEQAI